MYVAMADIAYLSLGWVLIAAGVVGCVVPLIPGPPIAFLALLVVRAMGDHTAPSSSLLVTAGVVTLVVTVLDYVVPAAGAKKFHCSRLGTAGCLVGTVVGLFFMPFGVIAGPFLGALVGELAARKQLDQALIGALGALLGFIFGVFLKLACCGYIACCFWQAVP